MGARTVLYYSMLLSALLSPNYAVSDESKKAQDSNESTANVATDQAPTSGNNKAQNPEKMGSMDSVDLQASDNPPLSLTPTQTNAIKFVKKFYLEFVSEYVKQFDLDRNQFPAECPEPIISRIYPLKDDFLMKMADDPKSKEELKKLFLAYKKQGPKLKANFQNTDSTAPAKKSASASFTKSPTFLAIMGFLAFIVIVYLFKRK